MDDIMRQMLRLTETQQRERERKQEIEHEQKLAAIRTQSRALVWTGPADELLNAIKKFYELGWIKADDLNDAIYKASLHFVGPDGKPIINPADMQAAPPPATTNKPKRLSPTINSPKAARKLEAYLESNGIGVTEFATKALTTDRTIRSFRKTGRVKRDILENIARAMGVTKEVLLKE
jgi:hypothetical protein